MTLSKVDLQESMQKTSFKEFQLLAADARYKKMHQEIQKIKKGDVLEVGCASGDFLEILKKEGWNCHGIDITKELVDQAKKKGINAKMGNVQNSIPFNKKFDVIIAGEIIEHMIDVNKFLEICDKHLKKNGTIMITTPNLVFWVNRILMLFGRKPMFAYADFHYKMFIWKDLREKISAHFKIQKVRGSHILVSTRRHPMFKIFEIMGDIFPTMSAHFIVIARKK
jgi:2-polyprenyl-3-methyl-5-hydroxy-6-metoxy-1,4-benzoquinol methylase